MGDKKQAIYAFRGGESRLFDALQSQLAGFNVQITSLDKNYRSCPEIIRFNNRVFSLDNLKAFLHRRLEDSAENKRHDIHFSDSDFEADCQYLCSCASVAGQGYEPEELFVSPIWKEVSNKNGPMTSVKD